MIARRRFFLSAAASLLAAPSIVRAASLMAIKPISDRMPVNLGGAAWWLEGDDILVKEMLHEMMNRQSESLAQAFRTSALRAELPVGNWARIA